MSRQSILLLSKLVLIGLFITLLAACQSGATTTAAPRPPTAVDTAAVVPSPSASPAEPTPTPQPLAARVNGWGITLSDYQAELERYQAAVGRELTKDDEKVVLDTLVDQVLLAQGAEEKDFQLDEVALQARIDDLVTQMGSQQALADWLAANFYTEPGFRQQLALSASASWMRDQIASSVPTSAEQVHARQILSRTEAEAAATFNELQNGADFTELARAADALTGGEMGWFPRGVLYDSGLEEAAFNLEAGQYSSVIQTQSGFHILQVIERDPNRPLDPQALLARQEQAVLDWLSERRQASQVEVLLP